VRGGDDIVIEAILHGMRQLDGNLRDAGRTQSEWRAERPNSRQAHLMI